MAKCFLKERVIPSQRVRTVKVKENKQVVVTK
jgi:hypothetical protein